MNYEHTHEIKLFGHLFLYSTRLQNFPEPDRNTSLFCKTEAQGTIVFWQVGKAGLKRYSLCMDEWNNQIEIKIAYLENMVDSLNELVITQVQTIEELTKKVKVLESKLFDLLTLENEPEVENWRPPHY